MMCDPWQKKTPANWFLNIENGQGYNLSCVDLISRKETSHRRSTSWPRYDAKYRTCHRQRIYNILFACALRGWSLSTRVSILRVERHTRCTQIQYRVKRVNLTRTYKRQATLIFNRSHCGDVYSSMITRSCIAPIPRFLLSFFFFSQRKKFSPARIRDLFRFPPSRPRFLQSLGRYLYRS